MLFKGSLVNIRGMVEEDLKHDVEYLNDPEVYMNFMTEAPLPMTLEKGKQWYTDKIKNNDIYEGISLSIETKDGKYIGGCGVNHIDKKNRIAKVYIFIGDKDYMGKGYGSEAMQLLLDFLFRETNINKAKLHVFAFNNRAIKSYEKSGFKVDAVSREAIFRDGKYHDEYIMSILKDEYFAVKDIEKCQI